MQELINPHDRFFKEVMSRQGVAADFLRNYLPEDVVRVLDVSSPELVPGSFVDRGLQEYMSDLLYRVQLRGGGDAYVYVLFEHKSYPDPIVAFKLLSYMVRIWEQALKQNSRLQPVLPIVVYHGKAQWKVSLSLGEVLKTPEALAPFVPDFRYWLCDLSHYDDEDIKGEVWLRVALLVLKRVFSPDLQQHLPKLSALWRELSVQETGLQYIETILRYLSSAAEYITENDLRQAVEMAIPEGGGAMTTLAEKWIEQGVQRGLQQGLERGLQQGLEKGLETGLRQGLLEGIKLGLKLRFGAEGLATMPEIRKIEDVDLLRAVQEGLGTVSTLDELRLIYRRDQG